MSAFGGKADIEAAGLNTIGDGESRAKVVPHPLGALAAF
jgi:hypothetical protein